EKRLRQVGRMTVNDQAELCYPAGQRRLGPSIRGRDQTERHGMSYLLGQLDPHGYALTEVTVGPGPGAQIVSHPEPRPAVQVTAVIDTGANHSAVSPDVIKALGIEPMATAGVDRIG